MSTAETSGANLLPDRSSLPQHSQQDEWAPITSSRWWGNLPEGISAHRARRNERADRARYLREFDHQAGHPHIPAPLIEALQRGINPGDTLTETIVTVDGQSIHVAVSSKGTGIPEPDSQGVWDELTTTYREISAAPYCADVVRPLPQEIAAIGWTNSAGQTVNVTPCKPPRLRSILSVALIPLARAGDLVSVSAATTSSAAAALVLGTSSLSPVPLPAEPAPDLKPKTGIAQRIPQAASTLRPEPVKVRVRPSSPVKVNVATQTSTPRPAPTTTRSAAPSPATSSASPAPAKRPEPTPATSEPAPPTSPARPIETGLETLLSSVPSVLQVDPT